MFNEQEVFKVIGMIGMILGIFTILYSLYGFRDIKSYTMERVLVFITFSLGLLIVIVGVYCTTI